MRSRSAITASRVRWKYSSSASEANAPAESETAEKSGTARLGRGTLSVAFVPTEIVVERMNEMGYDIQVTEFPSTSTEIQAATEGAIDILKKLYRAYTEGDADLTEINPLILKPTGEVHALDAKVTLDGNAAYRHDWAEYEATQVRDVREQAAHDKGLQYVGLDGTVGIIANGAGLAMSTLDVVNQSGGKPANFLDIGGGAKADVVKNALELVMMEDSLKGVMINIFGGITRCDDVAKGIIEATKTMKLEIPVVVRLAGTAEKEGQEILASSDKFTPATSMQDAGQKIVALAGLK